ncbi:MAG TPA: biotin synthase BioB [Verrucomicrobia bacterium]|nr:MAG: biotin synthase BioB [Lentisphaerae bacterium GWF2_57_35]HBA83611.1 biotin synthase BioB [Verrucomicrobiota bacterium]
MSWQKRTEEILQGRELAREEALAVLQSGNQEWPELLQAVFQVRKQFYGMDVNLHVINNAKSGACSENCAFCSQSAVSESPIAHYKIKTVEELIAGAREAVRLGAVKYCTVISGRAPSEKELDIFCEAFQLIKQETKIHLCVSPGLLTRDQARQLKQAGADRINHNLETSRRFFPSICTTHTYDARIETIQNAKAEGLEICCGGLVGLGETLEDRVELAFTLKELGVHSIPVNFFNPREGTPLAKIQPIAALDALRALAMFRLVNPSCDIRAAGGREANLRGLQVQALYIANSIFTQGYLTTPGQGHSVDLTLIADAGFRVAAIES